MAPRASERIRNAAAASGTPRVKSESRAGMRVFPLELVPLVQPFKRQGRLAFRIERMSYRGRLSSGRNNGDHTWSLLPHELEDLEYLFPDNMGAHTLGFRIVGLDQDGATLAIVDLPILSDGIEDDDEEENDSEAVIKEQREELDSLKALLVAKESELAAARQAPRAVAPQQQPDNSRQKIEAALAKGREEWKSELDRQLAASAARSAAQIEENRKAWQGKQDSLVSQIEERAEKQIAEARRQLQQDAKEAVAQAERSWKADEARRLAAAEATWQARSAKPLADATARNERAEAELAKTREQLAAVTKSSPSEFEYRKLREELAAARTSLAERDKDLASAAQAAAERSRLREELADARASLAERDRNLADATQATSAQRKLREELASLRGTLAERERDLASVSLAGEQARRQGQRDTEESLAQAEKAWKAGESGRLAALEADWQKKLAVATADANSKLQRVERDLADARAQLVSTGKTDKKTSERLQQLREELAQAHAAIAERDKELADADQLHEKSRARLQKEADAELLKAKTEWQDAETTHLAAVESAWQKKLDRMVADHSSRSARAEAALTDAKDKLAARDNEDESEQGKLREELEAARSALADRDRRLQDASAATDRARRQMQKDMDAALAKAKTLSKEAESARLAAAETHWREQAAKALGAAIARYEAAESALSRARAVADKQDSHQASRALDEFSIIPLTPPPIRREDDWARTRRDIDARTDRPAPRIQIHEDRGWDTEEEPKPKSGKVSGLVRDLIVVACFTTAVIAFYPLAQPYIPQDWLAAVGLGSGESAASQDSAPPPATATPAASAKIMGELVKGANIRSAPATSASVVATLSRGTHIEMLEANGNWTHVRIAGTDGKTQDGWVFSSFLKSDSDVPAAAPSTAATPAPANK